MSISDLDIGLRDRVGLGCFLKLKKDIRMGNKGEFTRDEAERRRDHNGDGIFSKIKEYFKHHKKQDQVPSTIT